MRQNRVHAVVPPGTERVSAGEQAHIASAAADARTRNTRRTYRSQWSRFEAWCRARGAQALPAAPALVAAYLTERGETSRASTVRVAAAAIGAVHRARGADDPTGAAGVRAVVAGIARQHAAGPDAAPRRAAPLSFEDAVLLMASAPHPRRTGRGVESARVGARRALEDAAIVSLAFCAGLRRSEIAALCWQDVTPAQWRGQLRVRVRAPKTNPEAARKDYRLLVGGFAAAVATLRTATVPASADRVVPLSGVQINRRLQALAERAGIAGVSSHSGRRGMPSELVRRGASTAAVRQAGGWRNPRMVARYASAIAVEHGALARYFGGAVGDALRPRNGHRG